MKEEWERPEVMNYNSILSPKDIQNNAFLFQKDYIKNND